MLIPRPYQTQVVDDLWRFFHRHEEGHPVIEACVGAGKSMMVAMIAQRAMSEHPGTRILVIVPSKELLVQNLQELRTVWPEANAGIYSASLKRKQVGFDLTYATIGSVYKKSALLGLVDLVLADECHGIATKAAGMWRQLIANLQMRNSLVRVIGLTGTAFRGNGIWLTDGEEPLFSHVSSRVTIRQLLDLGFLAPLTTVTTKTQIDTSGVRTVAGDYHLHDLAKVTDKAELVQAVCDEIVELGAERKKWLVFAVNVSHAHHVCAALCDRGVTAGVVTGNTPSEERDATIEAYRQGKLRCLVNVMVLTTGFNVKDIDFLVLLRATQSPVLYVQILGRALRTADGKVNALVADFTSTIANLGPVDIIKGHAHVNKRQSGAPTKLCNECGNPNPAKALECIECGHLFPEPDLIKHGLVASSAAVLSTATELTNTIVPISEVRYRLHTKQGSPLSLRVEYYDGYLKKATEWCCLSHEGFAKTKARRWWRERSTSNHMPNHTLEALRWLEENPRLLRQPLAITLSKDQKYPAIVAYHWQQDQEQAT